jgi:hypothetical protein
MSLLFALSVTVLSLVWAANMYRRQRARGIRTNWTKTWVTGIASIVVCLLAIGALIGLMEIGYPLLGLALFLIVIGAGLVAIAILVNRRWPIPAAGNSSTR